MQIVHFIGGDFAEARIVESGGVGHVFDDFPQRIARSGRADAAAEAAILMERHEDGGWLEQFGKTVRRRVAPWTAVGFRRNPLADKLQQFFLDVFADGEIVVRRLHVVGLCDDAEIDMVFRPVAGFGERDGAVADDLPTVACNVARIRLLQNRNRIGAMAFRPNHRDADAARRAQRRDEAWPVDAVAVMPFAHRREIAFLDERHRLRVRFAGVVRRRIVRHVRTGENQNLAVAHAGLQRVDEIAAERRHDFAEHDGQNLAVRLKCLDERKMDFHRVVFRVDAVVDDDGRQAFAHGFPKLRVDGDFAERRLEIFMVVQDGDDVRSVAAEIVADDDDRVEVDPRQQLVGWRGHMRGIDIACMRRHDGEDFTVDVDIRRFVQIGLDGLAEDVRIFGIEAPRDGGAACVFVGVEHGE